MRIRHEEARLLVEAGAEVYTRDPYWRQGSYIRVVPDYVNVEYTYTYLREGYGLVDGKLAVNYSSARRKYWAFILKPSSTSTDS